MPSHAHRYPRSLHDALPIWRGCDPRAGHRQAGRSGTHAAPGPCRGRSGWGQVSVRGGRGAFADGRARACARCAPQGPGGPAPRRSEEHTSELQSLRHLVCRRTPTATLVPYTTLFRSGVAAIREPAIARPVEAALTQLQGLVEAVLDGGRFPFVVGGEHSLTVAPVRALAARHKDLVVLHLEDRKSTRLNSSHLGISYAVARPPLPSFPTRRSSDLAWLRSASRPSPGRSKRHSRSSRALSRPFWMGAGFRSWWAGSIR